MLLGSFIVDIGEVRITQANRETPVYVSGEQREALVRQCTDLSAEDSSPRCA